MQQERMFDEIAGLALEARRILFVTGAGISAESGLPTYRGIGGLYDEAHTDEGIPIEEALSGDMIARHPLVTWKYLLQIERNCRHARPNLAHRAIAAIESHRPYVLVYTQNVDGLHEQAGSRNIVAIHGRVHDLRCTRCRHRQRVDSFATIDIPPICPRCFSAMRPDVVLFGEELPSAGLAAVSSAMDQGFDLVFSVGTSSLFPYIAEPVLRARSSGTPTVEINPGETRLSGLVDFPLRMRAAEALPRLWTAMQER